MMMMKMIRLLLLFMALLCLITTFANAQQLSPPSSCGDIEIRCPFRLKTNPVNCGNFSHELECSTHNNVLIFLVSDSQIYQVKSIDYENERMRLVDPGTTRSSRCSFFFPLNSLTEDQLSNSSFFLGDYGRRPVPEFQYMSSPVVFVSCSKQVNHSSSSSTMYAEDSTSSTSSCYRNDNAYSYALLQEKVGKRLKVSDLEASCMIYLVGWVSNDELPGIHRNTSFSNILDAMSHGFLVTWNICEKGFDCAWPDDQGVKFDLLVASINLLRLAGLIIGPRLFFGVPCLVILIICKCRKRHLSAYDDIEDFLQGQNNFVAVRYSYSDVKKITNNFKEKLGEGGFGSVFKGKLRSGIFVAVKMMNKSKASGKDFMNEVATIGRIHHVNVVQLIGFCVEGPKRALLYDFMPNGSLEKYLFSTEDQNMSLSYEKMFEISLGVARGIEYLHRGCDMQILHFDIKPHNILLEENFTPKISDFGLAKLHSVEDSMVSLTAARGTMGYMAPELFYKNIGRVSYKADVYSYGMLLMEMVGRRRNLNPFVENLSQIYFSSWVYDQINKGKDTCVADVSGEEERKMVKKMVLIGLWCIQMNPIDRPSMDKIVEMLERGDGSVPMPPKPLLCPNQLPTNEDHDDHEIQVENN